MMPQRTNNWVTMMHRIPGLLLGVMLFASSANAETVTEYQFDVIIFENLHSKQRYMSDLSAHEFIRASQQQDNVATALEKNYQFDNAVLNYQDMTQGELDSIYDKLSKNKRYNILSRKIWRQSALSDGATVQMDIDKNTITGSMQAVPLLDNKADSYLGGTINFTFSRYIHLNTNLILNHSISDKADTTLYPDPDYASRSVIRLQRKMRSNEVQYIDHPLLGILVNIKRYKKSESASNQPG